MIIYFPLLVCLIGVVIYALTKNADVKHIGDTMFWTGLLVTLLQVAGQKLGLL